MAVCLNEPVGSVVEHTRLARASIKHACVVGYVCRDWRGEGRGDCSLPRGVLAA